MRAIVITENSRCDMSPLTDRTPHALLPVAGKTVLLHTLEMLHRSHVREVDVVSPKLHVELASAVDNGSLFGMEVRFVRECPDLNQSSGVCLIVGLSNLVDVDWHELVTSLGVVKVHHLIPSKLVIGSTTVALVMPPYYCEQLSSDWNEIDQIIAFSIQFSDLLDRLIPINSFAAFHSANCRLSRGKFKNLTLGGRKFASGYHVGPKSKVNVVSLQSDHGYIGSNCRIEKSARLSGDVVIGDEVTIGTGAHVSDSVIFDSTYIGANTDFRNSIVNGNLMIRVDTGACLELDDPVLFGAIA